MLKIAITGGIGSGKSLVSDIFLIGVLIFLMQMKKQKNSFQ